MPWSVTPPDRFEELRFLAHDVGMPPLAVIRAATLVGAQAAGSEADMGTIAPGKLVDFVVLARDPLADIGNIASVVTAREAREYPRADDRPIIAGELKNR